AIERGIAGAAPVQLLVIPGCLLEQGTGLGGSVAREYARVKGALGLVQQLNAVWYRRKEQASGQHYDPHCCASTARMKCSTCPGRPPSLASFGANRAASQARNSSHALLASFSG